MKKKAAKSFAFTLPDPLASELHAMASMYRRCPKQQILALIQEALSAWRAINPEPQEVPCAKQIA